MRYAGANPLGAGQFVGFDSDWPVWAFYGRVPRPSWLDFFFPEDFGKITLAFPCMFQSTLRGVPEPAGARQQRAGRNAHFPGDAGAG